MLSTETLREMCARMRAAEAAKAELEEMLKGKQAELDDLRLKQIPALMETLGIKNATFQGIGRVQLAADLHCSTREGKKEAGIQWLRDCGQDGMVTESYNASSLKAYIKRLIQEGADIPEDLFNVLPFQRASIVKAGA